MGDGVCDRFGLLTLVALAILSPLVYDAWGWLLG